MRASRLNAVKDLLTVLVLGGFAAYVLLAALPRLERAQFEALHDQYEEEQERVVSQTVANAGSRSRALWAELRRAGLGDGQALRVLLDSLERERYGINGYGYFFALDRDWRILSHPVMEELEGRLLSDIRTPDGLNLGAIFEAGLAGAAGGFVHYLWTPPGRFEPQWKTTYVLRLESPPIALASGFYHSDLDETVARFAEISSATSSRLARNAGAALLGCGLLLAAIGVVTRLRIDATERDLARQLRSLARYKLILDESSLVSRTDPEGVITYVNDAFCATTGYSREEALGRNQSIERHPDTPLEAFRELWGEISAGRVWRGIIKNRKADGSSYYKRATIAPILDESGRIVEYISSGQDVTEIVERARDLETAFLTDPLTGLGNRIRLLRDVGRMASPCVALADIGDFAGLNRAFGQAAGDAVLRQVAAAILDFAEGRDGACYRVHADTFALLRDDPDAAGVAACAGALSARLRELTVTLGDAPANLLFHVGASPPGKDSFLFADIALGRAKASNKPLVLFEGDDSDPAGDALGNLAVFRAIGAALEGDGVFPVFQPIVDIATREVVKYECLMRLEGPSGRTMMPGEFLEIGKKTDLYRRLTLRIIERSIEAFRRRPWQFSVNLSVDDLMDAETMGYLVAEAGLKGVADRLIVEIVESEELHDFEGAVEVLDGLRRAGMGIAIDDFGSGYSNFEYLLRLDPDYLKIDRSIVQNLATDARAREMLRSIVQFAGKSGIKTVAEYIDSEEVLATVRELGVDFAQGWLFGKAGRELPPELPPPRSPPSGAPHGARDGAPDQSPR